MKTRKDATMIANPHAPELASYREGPILTNGALEFIYEKPVAYPLINFPVSIGLVNEEQFNVLPSAPQVFVDLALTEATFQGAGVVAGTFDHTFLEQPPVYNGAA